LNKKNFGDFWSVPPAGKFAGQLFKKKKKGAARTDDASGGLYQPGRNQKGK